MTDSSDNFIVQHRATCAIEAAPSTELRHGRIGIQIFAVIMLGSLPAIGQEPAVVSPASSSETPTVEDTPKAGLASTSSDEARDLLTDKFPEEWLFYQSAPTDSAIWMLKKEPRGDGSNSEELVLCCSGVVKGFAYTKEKFEDVELSLEWRFPKDESGNSGVLLFTQAEPRIWPTAVQVQLHQPTAGSVIASGDQKPEVIVDSEPNLARPINEWNECRIVCIDGDVTVEINGKKAGQLRKASPRHGSIALQSEGAEVHFRKIRVRPLRDRNRVKKQEK